jgi:hypothetical protein
MATENPIRKRRMGWGYANGKARARHGWSATCPTCRKEMSASFTRKQAKDELYRHEKQHEPGSVGRV